MIENMGKKSPGEHKLIYDHYDDEIDLVDIFSVLWKQRWFIAIVTVLFVVLATSYVFVKTPLYEIKTQIAPGITQYDQNGNAIRKVSPNDIAAWFSEEMYCPSIRDERNKCPKIDAKIISKTDNVAIRYYSPDPSQAENEMIKILNSLISGESQSFKRELAIGKNGLEHEIHGAKRSINQLRIEQDRLKNIEIIKINNKIDEINSKIVRLNKEIATIRKNRIDNQNAVESTRKKIDMVNKNTEEIMALREQMISDGSDKMALLMYSNSIQQNISSVNNLQNQILDLNKEVTVSIDEEAERTEEVENLETQIADLKLDRDKSLALREKELELDIEQAEETIETLKAKQGSLSIVEIINPPISSPTPVKPDKIKIVMLSFVIGIFLALSASFFRNFWKTNRLQIKANS